MANPFAVSRLARVAAVAALVIASAAGRVEAREPILALSGGGGAGPSVTGPIMALAGGKYAVVAVIILSKAGGDTALEYWREAHPREVIPVDVKDAATAAPALERATIIWFAGCVQSDLMAAIKGTPIPDIVRRQYANGIVVGGASAGMAIFAQLMGTGDADLTAMEAGRTKTADGLGIWPNVILDMHVLKRQRLPRFFSLVLDHPDHLGIAVDEGTAIIVSGGTLRVVGSSSVTVLDARNADVPVIDRGRPSAGRNLSMHVLTDGMTFQLGSAAPPVVNGRN